MRRTSWPLFEIQIIMCPSVKGFARPKCRWYNVALEARRVVNKVSGNRWPGGGVHQEKRADAGRDVDASR